MFKNNKNTYLNIKDIGQNLNYLTESKVFLLFVSISKFIYIYLRGGGGG